MPSPVAHTEDWEQAWVESQSAETPAPGPATAKTPAPGPATAKTPAPGPATRQRIPLDVIGEQIRSKAAALKKDRDRAQAQVRIIPFDIDYYIHKVHICRLYYLYRLKLHRQAINNSLSQNLQQKTQGAQGKGLI